MDKLTSQLQAAFASFAHPSCVVIHPGGDCIDCPDVAEALGNTDCDSVLKSARLVFSTIPMDCMTGDAFLHFLPAIANQSFHSDGGKRDPPDDAWLGTEDVSKIPKIPLNPPGRDSVSDFDDLVELRGFVGEWRLWVEAVL